MFAGQLRRQIQFGICAGFSAADAGGVEAASALRAEGAAVGVSALCSGEIAGVSGGVFGCARGVRAHHAGGGVGGFVSVAVVEGVGVN